MSDKKRFKQRNKRVIKVPMKGDESIACYCAQMETRFEDYTLKSYGQELTRKIEMQVCADCKEKYLDGPSVLQMGKDIKAKVLALANERCTVPENHIYFRYYKDVDVLYINYSNTKPVISKAEIDKGLIFGYDIEDKLTYIEILDFYERFADDEVSCE